MIARTRTEEQRLEAPGQLRGGEVFSDDLAPGEACVAHGPPMSKESEGNEKE
jgi:hypothetical protein